jgi:hypothetical protein
MLPMGGISLFFNFENKTGKGILKPWSLPVTPSSGMNFFIIEVVSQGTRSR